MIVSRIALRKYANDLQASGRAARWNPNDLYMLYTAASRSQACLENVVHRDRVGLTQLFNVMTIDIPDNLVTHQITLKHLPADWKQFINMPLTQQMGADWIRSNRSAVLKVPSSIIDGEVNYLLNPAHPDYKKIRLVSSEPFTFDQRIKA
ncbi:RES domain-containing protein [Mucilaginibacter corticis]|uniref:RES domain-containing protein n=1 Tax=Mucilaginibacter corticis TaxID=2597670 RepID=A0A556M7Q3_9SPHI|nr:RES family NAD+ phosphorylase [Mucilaginibacter corticis]TSJ35914.1 RES domain-containing protein [Mucilaginibacter corticis]